MSKKYSISDLHESSLMLRLFIARLSFLSFDEKCLLESHVQNVEDFLYMNLDDISLLVGKVKKTTLWHPKKILNLCELDIKRMSAYSVHVLFYDSIEYPYLLKQIYDPPYAIFCRGNVRCLDCPSVAIVGTRKASMHCANATKVIAKELAMAGIGVVSGLAFGIDAQAHAGALLAQGSELWGKTIAVLGSGVDTITPTSNKRLAGAILASDGCILSEYQLGSSVQSWQFVERNRIISALSRVILVMQAPPGSGALYTADFAIEHNRELCFFTGSIDTNSTIKAGNEVDLFGSRVKKKRCVENYIQDGATVIESSKDVLSLINSMTFLEERDFLKKTLTK